MPKLVLAALIILALGSSPTQAERWIIERGPSAGLPAAHSWTPAAAEMLTRSTFAHIRGLDLVNPSDVRGDVATLELNRLSSATGKVRVMLGKYARAKALIVVDVTKGKGAGSALKLSLRVIDLTKADRERTFATAFPIPSPLDKGEHNADKTPSPLDRGERNAARIPSPPKTASSPFHGERARVRGEQIFSSISSLCIEAAKWLGRELTEKETSRMTSPANLSGEALIALAKGTAARTAAERELYLKQATMLSAKSPLAWYLYARELHASDKNLGAISSYRKSIQLDGSRPAYHYNLGNAFFDEKRYAEAVTEYARAITIDAQHGASHENFISALTGQGLATDAVLAKYEEVTARLKPPSVTHMQAGRLLMKMKKNVEAVARFRAAAEADPTSAIAHFNLAHALERTAGKEKLPAVPPHPDPLPPVGGRGELGGDAPPPVGGGGDPGGGAPPRVGGRGDLAEAIVEYKKAIEIAPNYAKALNNLGFLYEGRKRDRLALFYYQSAVRFAPDYALAWNNLGILYGKRGKHRLEVKAFKKQVALTPKDPVAHFNLGVARHRTRQYRLAIESYKKSLALSPHDKPTHWHLANAYEHTADWNLSNNHWRKVLTLSPTEAERKTAEKHIRENAGR